MSYEATRILDFWILGDRRQMQLQLMWEFEGINELLFQE